MNNNNIRVDSMCEMRERFILCFFSMYEVNNIKLITTYVRIITISTKTIVVVTEKKRKRSYAHAVNFLGLSAL